MKSARFALACAGLFALFLVNPTERFRVAIAGAKPVPARRITGPVYPLPEQLPTLEALSRYLAEAKGEYRLHIQQASGKGEIPASRVYRAFSVVTTQGTPRYKVDEAHRVLCENPYLTLSLLYPLFHESRSSDQSVPPEVEEDVYLSLCARFASVETDQFALGVLRDVAGSECAASSKARQLVDWVVNQDSLGVHSARYRDSKDLESLEWFANDYLEINSLVGSVSEQAVETILGKPIYVDGPLVAYEGVQSDAMGQLFRRCLWIYYLHDEVLSWRRWSSSPEELDVERLKAEMSDRDLPVRPMFDCKDSDNP